MARFCTKLWIGKKNFSLFLPPKPPKHFLPVPMIYPTAFFRFMQSPTDCSPLLSFAQHFLSLLKINSCSSHYLTHLKPLKTLYKHFSGPSFISNHTTGATPDEPSHPSGDRPQPALGGHPVTRPRPARPAPRGLPAAHPSGSTHGRLGSNTAIGQLYPGVESGNGEFIVEKSRFAEDS